MIRAGVAGRRKSSSAGGAAHPAAAVPSRPHGPASAFCFRCWRGLLHRAAGPEAATRPLAAWMPQLRPLPWSCVNGPAPQAAGPSCGVATPNHCDSAPKAAPPGCCRAPPPPCPKNQVRQPRLAIWTPDNRFRFSQAWRPGSLAAAEALEVYNPGLTGPTFERQDQRLGGGSPTPGLGFPFPG